MVTRISRTDRSLVGKWWWTVDRWTLGITCVLMFLGLFLSFAASPSVAHHLKLNSFFFVIRHFAFLVPTLLIIIGVSLLDHKMIRRMSMVLFIVSIILIICTILFGTEIKGARRWLSFGGFSLQPSEFLKPAFTVLSAWLFSEYRAKQGDFPGLSISFVLFALSILVLLLQPDLGMVVLVTLIWFAQFFLAGLSIFWILVAIVMGVVGLGLSYMFLPHVTKRMDQFMDGSAGNKFTDRYQINQSLEAFMNGGTLGQGPGEGIVKKHLPDAHADFIFAVAGEEFGIILCVIIACLFLFILLRSFWHALSEHNLFTLLAVTGLTMQLTIQAMINMSSTLNLIPTKGMTLPFLSYGGSSMLALGISMGMILSLTRRNTSGPML